jgi:hypothetical protein
MNNLERHQYNNDNASDPQADAAYDAALRLDMRVTLLEGCASDLGEQVLEQSHCLDHNDKRLIGEAILSMRGKYPHMVDELVRKLAAEDLKESGDRG